MSYAQISDLQNRVIAQFLIDLCDFNGTGLFDTAAQTRAQNALDAASGIIDSYSGARYQLPLQVSAQLVDMCVDTAIYKLYVGRQRKVPETVMGAYENAVKFLRDVANEKASLDQAAVTQITELDTVTRAPGRGEREVFSDRNLKGF